MSELKWPSLYLDWYVHVPRVKYDFRSSGIINFKHNVELGEVDLSVNYARGNPEAVRLLAQRYHVKPENVLISSEGASGLNARIIRYLRENNRGKSEAIVEYPTYEPLLRKTQWCFPRLKRLERRKDEAYRLDADALRKIVSEKTGLLVLTNPHAPTGAVADASELKEILAVAHEFGFYVLCDEIYAEFERDSVPTVFSVDDEHSIATTSFTKAYGLGGLKLGAALAREEIVNGLYTDVLNTVGNTPNIVQLIAVELLSNGQEKLEDHKRRWLALKRETESWLKKIDFEYFPNNIGVTYWVKLPIKDTYKWTNKHTIPRYSLATVPGAFFLFKNSYKLVKSDWVRLSLGSVGPCQSHLEEAFTVLEEAINTYTC